MVLDLYNRQVIRWSMHHRADRQMVIRAVQMALWQCQGSGPVIVYSDRGCQFTSDDYQRFLKANALVCSMSAVDKANRPVPARCARRACGSSARSGSAPAKRWRRARGEQSRPSEPGVLVNDHRRILPSRPRVFVTHHPRSLDPRFKGTMRMPPSAFALPDALLGLADVWLHAQD